MYKFSYMALCVSRHVQLLPQKQFCFIINSRAPHINNTKPLSRVSISSQSANDDKINKPFSLNKKKEGVANSIINNKKIGKTEMVNAQNELTPLRKYINALRAKIETLYYNNALGKSFRNVSYSQPPEDVFKISRNINNKSNYSNDVINITKANKVSQDSTIKKNKPMQMVVSQRDKRFICNTKETITSFKTLDELLAELPPPPFGNNGDFQKSILNACDSSATPEKGKSLESSVPINISRESNQSKLKTDAPKIHHIDSTLNPQNVTRISIQAEHDVNSKFVFERVAAEAKPIIEVKPDEKVKRTKLSQEVKNSKSESSHAKEDSVKPKEPKPYEIQLSDSIQNTQTVTRFPIQGELDSNTMHVSKEVTAEVRPVQIGPTKSSQEEIKSKSKSNTTTKKKNLTAKLQINPYISHMSINESYFTNQGFLNFHWPFKKKDNKVLSNKADGKSLPQSATNKIVENESANNNNGKSRLKTVPPTPYKIELTDGTKNTNKLPSVPAQKQVDTNPKHVQEKNEPSRATTITQKLSSVPVQKQADTNPMHVQEKNKISDGTTKDKQMSSVPVQKQVSINPKHVQEKVTAENKYAQKVKVTNQEISKTVLKTPPESVTNKSLEYETKYAQKVKASTPIQEISKPVHKIPPESVTNKSLEYETKFAQKVKASTPIQEISKQVHKIPPESVTNKSPEYETKYAQKVKASTPIQEISKQVHKIPPVSVTNKTLEYGARENVTIKDMTCKEDKFNNLALSAAPRSDTPTAAPKPITDIMKNDKTNTIKTEEAIITPEFPSQRSVRSDTT